MNKYNIEYVRRIQTRFDRNKKIYKNNLQEPETAQKLITKIKKVIDNLNNNPEIYVIIDEDIIRKLEIRKLIIDNYIVFYRIKK